MSFARALATDDAPISECHGLGMAEMGFAGLSEQWLMRRAGDLHWRLIAQQMGQREAVFTCTRGEPLYAAFCATSLRLAVPEAARLGGSLQIEARLYRVGRSRLASEQMLLVQGRRIGHVRMISTFVGRGDPASNHSIVRRNPRVMVAPTEAPPAIARMARAAALIARLPATAFDGPQQTVLPCPATDFNAAGLLYFPSFAALTDRADFARGGPCDRFLTARNVIYLGNAEPGERIEVAFAATRAGHRARLRIAEGRTIALISSRFQARADLSVRSSPV